MVVSTTENVESAEILRARVGVYRFLLAAMDYPNPDQFAWMKSAAFQQSLDGLCEAFDVEFPRGELVPEEFADHESRYLACFEIGFPTPPVPLLASHYNHREPVPRVIHEHILLYRLFGVQVRPGRLEPADHLVHQLAFLIHLDELQMAGKVERASLAQARYDFLTRHLVRWVPQAAAEGEEKRLPPLYCALLSLLTRAVKQDQEMASDTLTLKTP